jgi:peptide/nickel transport system substrate-binding protein
MLDRRVGLTGLSLTLGLLLAISGCGGGATQPARKSAGLADCTNNPNSCNSGATKKGGTFTYVIEKDIELWDTNDTNANTFETGEVLQPLLPGVFNVAPDLKPTLNTDLMVSVTKTSDRPQTIVYKIQPNAVWNDGTPINVDDFVFAWKTQNGKDCPPPPPSDPTGTKGCSPKNTAGWDRISSVKGSDGGKTVTVVFSQPYADWQSLFGAGYGLWPAHVAQQVGGDLDSAAGLARAWQAFNRTPPKFSGGPYIMRSWQKGVAATLVPNPRWYGRTKPALSRLIFRVISDATQEPTALQNDEVQGIYPQPQVDLVSQIKKIPNVTYAIGEA